MLMQRFENSLKSIAAFSLIELLVVLFLGAVLLAMVSGLYVTGVSTGTKSLKYSRLHADLQSLMAIIETDIRRAGYGGNAYLVGVSADKSIDINDAKNCIVYYYNHNETASVENKNKMAFSLKDNTLKFKTGVGLVANDVCAVTTGWEAVSDNQFIAIKQLVLTENIASTASATIRSVHIELAGELVSDSDYTHTLSTQVQVRNLEFNE